MKEIITARYKKIESAFEGQVYTPEQEDDFVDWTLEQKKRDEKLPFRGNVPSRVKRHGRPAGHRGRKRDMIMKQKNLLRGEMPNA